MVNGKLSICITGLEKSYGRKKVLKGINLEVFEGELFAFIGANGAGKSTTIESMIGLRTFDKGTIEIEGHSIKKDPIDVKKAIGYVPSEPLSYTDMTGMTYLEFIASIYCVEE